MKKVMENLTAKNAIEAMHKTSEKFSQDLRETMKDAGVRMVLTSGPVRTGGKVKFCVVCGKRISKLFFWKKTCSGFCQSRYKSGYAPYKF